MHIATTVIDKGGSIQEVVSYVLHVCNHFISQNNGTEAHGSSVEGVTYVSCVTDINCNAEEATIERTESAHIVVRVISAAVMNRNDFVPMLSSNDDPIHNRKKRVKERSK